MAEPLPPSTPGTRWQLDDVSGPAGAIGAALAAGLVGLFYQWAGFEDGLNRWFIPASIVSGALVGSGLTAFRRLLPLPGAAPGGIVVALVATYLCVPETGQFPTVVWLPLGVLLLELLARRPLHPAWYAAAAIPIAWAGMYGMTDRFSAMAGALFAWWGFVLLPAVTVIRPIRPASTTALVVAGVGMFAALVGVRTGGIVDGRSESIALLALVAAGSIAVGAAIATVGIGSGRQRSG